MAKDIDARAAFLIAELEKHPDLLAPVYDQMHTILCDVMKGMAEKMDRAEILELFEGTMPAEEYASLKELEHDELFDVIRAAEPDVDMLRDFLCEAIRGAKETPKEIPPAFRTLFERLPNSTALHSNKTGPGDYVCFVHI